jgi:hypothetical protein
VGALAKSVNARVASLNLAIETVKKRLNETEKARVALSAAGSREAALVAAIGQLREAVRSGRPFTAELETVRAMVPAGTPWDGALKALAPAAAKGVVTLAVLRGRFPAAATRIVRADRVGSGATWLDRTWERAKSVVVIRRTGPNVAGDTAEALVAQAEARLDDGDLAGAVAQIGKLRGPAAAAAAPWREAAEAHLAALKSVSILHAEALKRIAATGAAPKGPAE